jgi:hypothetical protein
MGGESRASWSHDGKNVAVFDFHDSLGVCFLRSNLVADARHGSATVAVG